MQIIKKTIDVRPILAEGGCPFDHIMEVGRKLPSGSHLTLIAPFDPIHPYEALKAIGFCPIGKSREGETFKVDFRFPPLSERTVVSDEDLTHLEPADLLEKTLELHEETEIGQTFRITTNFEPASLLSPLDSKDCLTESQASNNGAWHTWILKRGIKKCEH